MDIILRAKLFAFAAHRAIGQRRKYTNACYTTHLQEVADLLESVGCDDETIAIGFLHDVVEDTEIDIFDIRDYFGDVIADGVSYCTEISTKADGNRADRKAKDAAHFADGSSRSQSVKVADIISNVRSIVRHDLEFAKVYVYEKQHQLSLLSKANSTLIDLASSLINESI